MSASSPLENQIDALLCGRADLSLDIVELMLPGDSARADAALATLFWAKWQRHSGLHENFLAALEPLPRALKAIPAAQWIGAAGHPLWPLLELIQSGGVGYQPELGRAAEKLLSDLQPLGSFVEHGEWNEALRAAQTQSQQEQHRLQRLEKRLIDGERGLLRSRRAQQQAARVLNRAMAGKHLPEAMLAYLHDAWYRELQWSFLQFGEESAEWERRIALTSRLIASLQAPGDDPDQRQRVYALIPDVGHELREALGAHAAEHSLLEQQLALIETHHVAILKNRPLPTVPCALIATDDPWADATTSVSRDLLQKVAALELNSWFMLRDGENERRIKLVLKMDDTAQLLFVNRVGMKALQKTFEEFAYLMALDAVVPLPSGAGGGRELLRQLLLQLMQRGLQRQRARAEDERREQEQQRAAAEEAQRRQAAKEKAIAEAAALAAAQARAEAQAQVEAEQRAREQEQVRRRVAQEQQAGDAGQRSRQARQSATLLVVGSWVEFYDEIGNAQRLKLAVKLPSSGKLIFVDREGIRRGEYEHDGFAARLLEGSARVLDAGPQFEDTLARVVGSLRRDRSRE